MPYVKVSEKITTPQKLAEVVKSHLTSSGLFSEHQTFTNTHFSLKHKNGKYFVFIFEPDEVVCFIHTSVPNSSTKTGESNTKTSMRQIAYPLYNLYLTSTKTFVAISAEIRNTVFRHLLIGCFESFVGRSDGEFVYGTNSIYANLGEKNYKISDPIFTAASYKKLRGFYEAFGVVGIAQPSTSYKYKNHVAYNGSLVESVCGFSSTNKDLLFSLPPINIMYGSMPFNGRSPMNTHVLFYSQRATEAAYSTPMFFCNELATIAVDNLQPADIVLDDWIVFPVISKLENLPNNEVGSSNIGVAFKFK